QAPADVGDEQNPVHGGDTKQRNKADGRGNARVQAEYIKSKDAAGDGKRDSAQGDEAVAQGIKQAVEQHHDQQKTKRHDDREPLLRLNQGAELSRPFQTIAFFQLHVLADPFLRFGDSRAEIAAPNAIFDRDKTFGVLAIDVGRAGLQVHFGNI